MERCYRVFFAMLLTFFIAACSEQKVQSDSSTAKVIINADIVTMDDSEPTAQALAYRDNKIIAIGSNEDVLAKAGKHVSIYDAEGKAIVPGFIETHDHFYLSSSQFLVTDIQPFTTPTLKEALSKLSKTKPDSDGWILAFGADQTLYQEKRGLAIAELDALFPNNPVFVYHLSGHGAFANSKALQLAGIDKNTPNPTGGYFEKDEQGNLTGFLSGMPAFTQVKGFPTPNEESARLAAQQRASVGVTTASELAFMDEATLAFVSKMTADGQFPMRIVGGYFSTAADFDAVLPRITNYENELLTLPFIKTWTDGSIQGGTGSLIDGYYDADFGSDGVQGTQDFFNQQVLSMYQANMWPAIHANGDNAVEIALNAIEYAQKNTSNEVSEIRPQIIHAQVTNKAQIARMAKLNANPSFFVTHVYYWGDLHYQTTLGPEKSKRLSALGDAFELDIKASMHNDPPVSPVNPLLNMWIAIKRESTSGQVLGKAQAITAQQALQAYTINAAYQFGLEKQTGSLSTGKLADFVLLSANPLKVAVDDIKDIKVISTVLNGREIFENKSK